MEKKILNMMGDHVIITDMAGNIVFQNNQEDTSFKEVDLLNIGNNIFKNPNTYKLYKNQSVYFEHEGKKLLLHQYTDITDIYNDLVYCYGIDQLTKLPGRVKIDEYLNSISKTRRNYVLAIADIDDFKHVNDTYGHHAGDFILSEISKIFRSHIRNGDLAGRWGGEEFILVFDTDEEDNIITKLEIIREEIANHVFLYDNKVLNITISIGVSKHIQGHNVFDEVKEADKALYYVKENGKNAVVAYENMTTENVKSLKKEKN